MDYKEKYDKLVEAVKVLQETNPSDEGIQNWVNDNVPELAESEDERIRKEFCKDIWTFIPNEKAHKYISWLEKQGEQKSIDELTQQEAMDIAVAKCFNEGEQKLADVRTTGYWHVEDVEQKPAWSEEDETGWTNTMIMIKECATNHYTKDNIKLVIDWLKSLKYRYTWKPSDEQIKILYEILNFAATHEIPYWNNYIFGTLNNLIRQLKKLKGE